MLWLLKTYWPILPIGFFGLVASIFYDWYITFSIFSLLAATWFSYSTANLLITKNPAVFDKRRIFRFSLLFGLPVATFSFAFGYVATPAFVEHEKASEIFLIGSQPDTKSSQPEKSIKGRVLFSLSQYLIILRSDDVFVSLPVVRIERIETPKDEPWAPRPSPTAATSPSATPATSPAATPSSSETVSPQSTPVRTPSTLPSTQPCPTIPAIPPHN
jgi:hypothetical protein